MSKWNVRTATGQVADVAQVKQQLSAPRLDADVESDNPTFQGSSPKWAPPTDGVSGGGNCCVSCLENCGACIESRRGKICLAGTLLIVVVVSVLVGLLYPRFPTMQIDRTATFRQSGITTSSDNTTRIQGNVTLYINNNNLYSIIVDDMLVNITIGKVPNQVSFEQEIGHLEMTKNGKSTHVLPYDIVVPPWIDSAVLVRDIGFDCVTNVNKMKYLLSARAKVKAMGMKLNYKFGPKEFFTQCI